MDRSCLAPAAALCALLCIGCAYRATTSLAYDPAPVAVAGRLDETVAVLPLEDAREPRLSSNLRGHLYKSYIPFLPYFRVPYERLDESYMMMQERLGHRPPQSARFTVAFAQEMARDLRSSGLFRKVEFEAEGRNLAEYDLILRGTLRSTEFVKSFSSYMLGYPGVALWLLPIPCCRDAATVAMDLVLEDASGAARWSYSFSERASRLFTLYNASGSTTTPFEVEIKRYGSNDLGIDGDSYWAYHAAALRRGLAGAKASLAEALGPASR